MNNASYVIALYIRLSIEDNKVDSLSIENQKIALHQYVAVSYTHLTLPTIRPV